MTVKHHIGEDLILAYGIGELDEAVSLLIATHMALCPECRVALEAAEAIGGVLLETEAGGEVADLELRSVFKKIDHASAVPCAAGLTSSPGNITLPQPLRDYVKGDVDDLKWRNLGGGVRHILIDTGPSASKARLLNIPAGAEVPEHSHGGLELTLVLGGSFHDRGVWFRRGDVEEADETVEHQPVAGPEEACICLAVTDAPLRFRSLIPRLAQSFMRI